MSVTPVQSSSIVNMPPVSRQHLPTQAPVRSNTFNTVKPKGTNNKNIRQQIVRTRAQIATSPPGDCSAMSGGQRKPMQIDLMMLNDFKNKNNIGNRTTTAANTLSK